MAKKSSFNLFYLIGMIAVVVGSFLPIIRISLGILGKIDFTIGSALDLFGGQIPYDVIKNYR